MENIRTFTFIYEFSRHSLSTSAFSEEGAGLRNYRFDNHGGCIYGLKL